MKKTILLSAIEKIATSYHAQPNFLPKQKNSGYYQPFFQIPSTGSH
jgi:hypothetical protein